jgi:hypothetical protein
VSYPKLVAEFIKLAPLKLGDVYNLRIAMAPYKGDLGEGVNLGRYIVTGNLADSLDVYTSKDQHLIGYSCTPKSATAKIILHHLGLLEED